MAESIVLIGTTKGLFCLLDGDLQGPHFKGTAVDACAYDSRTGTILVGSHSEHWGPSVFRSDDLGATWQEPEGGAIRFPTDTGAALARVWQIQPGGDDEPGVVWAGVEPAALFRSEDNGETFELERGLWDHPHRPQWEPGGGGLCLHSIVLHPTRPERRWVAISAAGVYRTDDDGATWSARNAGIKAVFLPDPDPEFGQCVHKIAFHPDHPDTLYAQHHWGVYRSDDGGDQWDDVGSSLISDFGFPLVVDPNDPDRVYVIPLESDLYRCTPEHRCRVFRTSDGGGSWKALGEGLPQHQAHLTVLRDAFCHNGGNPTGLWFGSRTGEVFASHDAGDSWEVAAAHLPPVLCVRAAETA